MEGWSKLQSSFANLNIGQSAGKFAKGFQSSVQATRERLGQISADDITELPQEYKDLEARVDALRQAHLVLLKIGKVYESESYDYPAQIQETITELGTTIGTGITNFAATNLKGTNLPAPAPTSAPRPQHKTLPHALGRASTQAAQVVQESAGPDDRLGRALAEYAGAWDKISQARIAHDQTVVNNFTHPWQQTLNQSINLAMKARQAVRTSRLELDAAKQTLKTATPAKQEHARLEVENAEDDLVQKTEVAITLMKRVLDDAAPVRNINELVKAQLAYFQIATEALNAVQGEIEELAVAAEGEYRSASPYRTLS